LAAFGALAEWASNVISLQRSTSTAVLWFDFTTTPVERALRDWAQTVVQRVEHDDDKDRAARNAASAIENDPAAGWMLLCGNAGMTLALMHPPQHAPDWFWEGLRDHMDGATAIVLAGDYPAERAEEDWMTDTVTSSLREAPAIAPEHHASLIALALLEAPAARFDVEAKLGRDNVTMWLGSEILVETSAGCWMPASISTHVLAAPNAGTTVQAHRLAYELLDGPVARRLLTEREREHLRRARLRHAIGSQDEARIALEAKCLLYLYEDEHRPAAFLAVLEHVGPELSEVELILGASWAYLSLGDPDAARVWVNRLDADALSSTENADRLVRLAEIEKSTGGVGYRVRAREQLESALGALGEAADDASTRLRLICKHEIARLVHFFERDPRAAVAIYDEVQRGWSAMPYSEIPRAITLRNLAEAYMDRGDAGDLGIASATVDSSRRLIPPWTQHSVVSELEYLAGRLAKRAGASSSEVRNQFQLCRDIAIETNHLMVGAIAEARLFWLDDGGIDQARDFDAGQWARIVRELALFSKHAWVARTLINGYVGAARRLARRGERSDARRALSEARAIIDAHPGFDAGDDCRRMATVFAGLEVLEPGQGWWDRFNGHACAAAWLGSPGRTAPEVWEEWL
jgi:hypothetical protein